MSAEPEGVTFEVERIAFSDPGRLEVIGRWYGVRGRRFMRPTLIFKHRGDGSEGRALADLEHKPWAAQDGDQWTAVFTLEVGLQDAVEMELAVAPDITVELARADANAKLGRRQAAKTVAPAAQARSPRVRADPVRSRPRQRLPEVERMRERVSEAEQSVEHERAKRETVEQTLEEERRTGRQLRAELGRVRAELELAGTVQRELDSASSALDALRSQVRDSAQRLETAERELGEERRATESLRRQLADAEAAVTRLSRTGEEAASSPGAEMSDAEPTSGHPVRSERLRGPAGRSEPVRGDFGRGEVGRAERLRRERSRAERLAAERHHPAPPRSERPLNPSLRSGGWLIRSLAVVVMLIVIGAIVLVIRSTVG